MYRQFCKVWTCEFQPRDAMPASAALAMALCLSVCLSVASRCSIETAGRIDLNFGMKASFDHSYTVFLANSGICKNKGTSIRNFFLNFHLNLGPSAPEPSTLTTRLPSHPMCKEYV